MSWGYNAVTDEEADEAYDDYVQEGYERGVNMDDGRGDDEPS